jgi:hypothetical protein
MPLTAVNFSVDSYHDPAAEKLTYARLKIPFLLHYNKTLCISLCQSYLDFGALFSENESVSHIPLCSSRVNEAIGPVTFLLK